MTNLSGVKIQFKGDTDVYTIQRVVKTYLKTPPRFSGDTDPIPAGTVVVQLSGGGLNQRRLRPGTFTIVK